METQANKNTASGPGWLGGAILIVIGAAALLGQFLPGISGLFWAMLFVLGGAVFGLVYFLNRANWWALIPAYAMIVIGVLIMMGVTAVAPGEVIGIYVMLAIGFPFLYVYLRNRANWWALIPAYVMFAIAGIIAVSSIVSNGELIGSFVMFAIAAPFLYVYMPNRKNWWALIPAGVMTLIGLGLLPATVPYAIPIALIVIGLFLLFRQSGGGRRTAPISPPPATGPAADKPLSK